MNNKKKSTKKASEKLSYYQRKKLERLKEERRALREQRKKQKEKEAKNPKIAKRKKSKKQGPDKAKVKRSPVTKPKKQPRVKAVEILPQLVVVDLPELEEEKPIYNPTAASALAGKNIYLNNRDLLAAVKDSKKRGEMSDKLARMLQLLCAKYAKKGNFINYCVDSATLALTKSGWKTHQQMTTDDEILSYNLETQQLVWSKVLEVFRNNYSSTMHKLATQGLDALVTPNHKFVSIERGLIPVEDIICNEHIVLMGQPVADGSIIYPDDVVELVGWCVTEGHYSTKSKKRHSIQISQKQGAKANRIRELLQSLAIPHKEYLNKQGIILFNCTGVWISKIHQTIAPSRVPACEFLLDLIQTQRLLLIKTMVAGDGWMRPSGGMSYVQKSPEHIDAFLMLCTLAGQTVSVTPMTYKTPTSRKNPNGGVSDVLSVNIYSEPKTTCRAEWIDFHGGKQTAGGRRNDKPNLPTEQYTGQIWCPRTEYGTFVARRGKYIYITGNTYNDDMQGYAMMMLVRTWNSFDPERSENAFAFYTQCIKSSFIQYLNQEKRQRTIRDMMLVDQGLNPSFSYEGEGSDQHILEDEQDFYAQKRAADLLTRLPREYEEGSTDVDRTPSEPDNVESNNTAR